MKNKFRLVRNVFLCLGVVLSFILSGYLYNILQQKYVFISVVILVLGIGLSIIIYVLLCKLNHLEEKRKYAEQATPLQDNTQESLLVFITERIFWAISFISIFYFVKKIVKRYTKIDIYRFIDIWVICNLALAIIGSVVVFYTSKNLLFVCVIFSVYGGMRILEILIYQINVVLFDHYREKKKNREYKVKSVLRIIIALFYNYFEIIFWYSVIMTTFSKCNGSTITSSYLDYMISTILCVAVFDSDKLNQIILQNYVMARVVFLEITSGLIMTVISFARFLGLIPKVREFDE